MLKGYKKTGIIAIEGKNPSHILCADLDVLPIEQKTIQGVCISINACLRA